MTGYLPLTNAAAKAMEAAGHYAKNPNQKTAIDQMNNGKTTVNSQGIRLGNFIAVRDVIEEQVENIFSGNKTPKQGLDDAVAKGNEILKEFAPRLRRGQASATGRPALVGCYSGKSEEVDHPEVSGPAVPLRDRGLPPPLGVQVGVAVELEQPDEDLADDTAADRPEVPAPVPQGETLVQDIEPERRGVIKVQLLSVGVVVSQ